VLYVAAGAADHNDSMSHTTHGGHSPAHSIAMGLSIFVAALGILLSAQLSP